MLNNGHDFGFIPIFERQFYIMSVNELIEDYSVVPITRQTMLLLLKDYKRPDDKIGELVKNGELITLKNGLYIPGPKSKITRPEPFMIANHLWGPSYISMETAMYYHGLIPERVFEVSSVTTKSTKTYRTEVGRFSYRQVGLPYYSFGIRSVKLTEKQVVMMASPEKALCDKIVLTPGVLLRSVVQAEAFLIEDLRIDEDSLVQLDADQIETWIDDAPKRDSLKTLVKTLRSL